MKFALSNSPSRFTGRGWGMGPDLQIRNYQDIGKISMRAQNYLCKPAEGTKSLLPFRAQSARRVTERNTSLHSGSIDSVQNPEASFVILNRYWRELKLAH